MTREEILAMKPGLDLDMLIGQYVIKFGDYLKENGKRPAVRDGRYKGNYFELPDYSTDISAAWEVVEKMKNKKHLVDICQLTGSYIVRFEDEDENEFKSRTRTAPEAICKAALLAVMEV